MALARFIFAIMLLLLHARGVTCTTQSIHQGSEKKTIIDQTGIQVYGNNLLTPQKEMNKGVEAIEESNSKRVMRGRKMKLERSGKKATSDDASPDSVRIMTVQRKSRGRNPRQKNVNISGTFTADYHVPKSHPPRNN